MAASFAHDRARRARRISREDQEDDAQSALVAWLEERSGAGVGSTLGFLTVAVGRQTMNTVRRNRRRSAFTAPGLDLDRFSAAAGVSEHTVVQVLQAMPARMRRQLESVWCQDSRVRPGTLRVWRTRIRRWIARNDWAPVALGPDATP